MHFRICSEILAGVIEIQADRKALEIGTDTDSEFHPVTGNSRRFYGEPNRYHQVAIYSKTPLERLKATEPVNGLLCKSLIGDHPLVFYGNVITIKDRWSHSSMKTFSDRLEEQLLAIESLSRKRTLIGGDFNLRVGWHSGAHRAIKERLAAAGWLWPTEERNDTVQQVLHSPDLQVHTKIIFDVQRTKCGNSEGLSDHPFLTVEVATG